MTASTLSHWGWGYAERFPDAATRASLAQALPMLVGFEGEAPDEPVPIEQVQLRTPRVQAPPSLVGVWSAEPEVRIRHTYGRSYPDQLRGYRGDFAASPDAVVTPRSEDDLATLLAWASEAGVAVVPRGGGTSVCGGVTPERDAPWVCLSLGAFDQIRDVDRASLTASLGAGLTGPQVEAALGPHGLSLRHYPQSFEFSTVGGWVATRAGGHFATNYTHIDDLVASVRMVTPAGVWESRRLPGSGAGPSPDRWVLGSEGIFGVITEASLRVRPRPTFKAKATMTFDDYGSAVAAVRDIAQARLYPSNCRLLDRREALLNRLPRVAEGLLLLAFESADHPVGPALERAMTLAATHGGACPDGPAVVDGGEATAPADAGEAWKQSFFDGPYLQSLLISVGVVADTFETAVPWDRFEALHRGVIRAVRAEMKAQSGHAFVSCRFTHVYPDGPAPYFTWLMPAQRGRELEQWLAVKRAASDAVLEHGGTITHHHAVGRLHRPWYARQRPAPFGAALTAVKRAMDPAGVLNPGVLVVEGDDA
ncbi:MAG: FAD-binding oxidoreductase [Myxococcales bacterium]|nr:FAD-binding oxidoreductase [Myxococcales bacterium]